VDLREVIDQARAVFDGSAVEARPPRYPEAAVEIGSDRITAVRVAAEGKERRPALRAFASEPLPAGAIEPSLTRPNILAPEPVALALRRVLDKVGPGEHRISLLIPDDVARVALLSFATLPRTRREIHDLARFRMAKSLPFKPEEALLDVNVLSGGPAVPAGPGGASVLAVFVHRAVVEQYEALVKGCGLWPGLVGLPTFELYNLFRPVLENARGSGKDVLLVNATRAYLSLLIFRDDDLLFYRCKPYAPGDGQGDGITDLRREIYTSIAFYQEKLLGRGLGTAFARASGLPRAAVQEAITAETGGPVVFLALEDLLPVAPKCRLAEDDAALAAPACGAVVGRRA
jgi:type IV pilus assembly protein PilM